MPWQGPESHKEVFHTCLPALHQHQGAHTCRLKNMGPRTSKVLSCPVSNESGSKKVQSWPSKKFKKLIYIYIYMYFLYICLKRVILCLLLPIFFSLFTWNQQGLNHLSRLMKAELLVDSHDSRRCCSLKSPEWWETLIISRELVTRAEDFE